MIASADPKACIWIQEVSVPLRPTGKIMLQSNSMSASGHMDVETDISTFTTLGTPERTL